MRICLLGRDILGRARVRTTLKYWLCKTLSQKSLNQHCMPRLTQSVYNTMKERVSMTKKYNNGRPQTTLRHREEETQTTDNHNTIKE